jgi:hypothetical protein
MAVAKRKRPNAVGRPATTGSIKKGEKLALGNDKTARLSTFIELALKSAKTLPEYEGIRSQAEAIATDFVDSYWKATTVLEKKAVLQEIADRTEGKARQQLPQDKEGNEVKAVLVQFIGEDDANRSE